MSDTYTGLVWQRTVSAIRFAFTNYLGTNAQDYCDPILNGYWRLPTLDELESLVDRTAVFPPCINQTAFPNTPADAFWTSSPYAGSSDNAWTVYFSDGMSYYDVVGDYNWVRCVR